MKYVSAKDMRQTGRNLGQSPRLPEMFLQYNADFGATESYNFSFSDINQSLQFGIPETLFVDNSSNPEAIEVTVTGTDQFFTVPAYAEGYFTISAAINSLISLYSVGGATDIVTVCFYNYTLPSSVWYAFGPTNTTVPRQVYGTMTSGVAVAAQSNNKAIYIGAIDNLGTFRPVLCDNTGALTMSGTINIASISIPDGNDITQGAKADAAVTNPALSASLIALTKGNLTGINSTVTGIGAKADAAVTNPASDASVIASLKGNLTANNLVATNLGVTTDASVASGGNGSVIAQLKGANTVLGAQADAAIASSASSGSLIAFVKGIVSILANIQTFVQNKLSGTANRTSVVAAAANTQLLASNSNRKGATIYNDSASATLYLGLGTAAASTSDFTAQILPGGYYEVPFGYYGEIRGIWSAAVGNARITEIV